MKRSGDRRDMMWRGMGLAVAGLVAVAAFALPGCGGSEAESAFAISPAYEAPPSGEVRIAGEALAVRLLHTAVDRRYGAERSAFSQSDGSPRGLLYVFPAESTVRFNPNITDFATGLAFLDEDGSVLHLEEVPATPREDDPFGMGARTTATFPFAAGSDVRFLLQLPLETFRARGLQVGDTVELPAEQLAELEEEDRIESDRPVATLIYERRPELSEGRSPADAIATAKFSMRVADSRKARDELLTPQGIGSLKAHEVGFVRFSESRPVSITVRRGFERSFFVIPFEVTERDQQPLELGALVELRPFEQHRRFELYSPAWAAVSARRNWEYRSARNYDGYFLFSFEAIEGLSLTRQRNAFALPSLTFFGERINIDIPPKLINKPAEPESNVVEVGIDVAGEVHRLPVRVVDSHHERVRGLRLADALPTAQQWAEMQSAEAEENNGEAFAPELDQAEATALGYWLRFDKERPRPTHTGGLATPYDIVFLDRRNLVVAVQRNVTDDSRVYPQSTRFLTVGNRLTPYQSALLLPAGFVDHVGMTVERDGQRRLALVSVEAPGSVQFEWPEPERYPVTVGGHEIEVEVAYHDFDRQRGLMWRRDLPEDGGMIFLFRNSETRHFIMLNCLIDLTTAFITDEGGTGGRIATLANMFHPALPNGERPRIQAEDPPFSRAVNEQQISDQAQRHYGSQVPVRYVLEMPYNWFRTRGVQEEARVELGEVIRRYLELAE